MAGKRFDDATLEEIKRLYEGRDLTVQEIADRYGVRRSAISALSRRHGWVPRVERRAAGPRQRRERLESVREQMRLASYRALTAKLEQMEAALRRGELSSEDYARDVRSLALEMARVESRTETETEAEDEATATGTHGDRAPKPDAGTAAGGDVAESERLGREIMERFERIQRRRSAEGAAG